MEIAKKLGRSLLRSSSFLFVRCLKRDDDGDDDEGGLATMTMAVAGDYWPLTTVFGRQEAGKADQRRVPSADHWHSLVCWTKHTAPA